MPSLGAITIVFLDTHTAPAKLAGVISPTQ
jgi:hypothetical protein